MLGFKIDNTFLDMYPDTSISWQVNSPIYTGGDPTNIQGSYSFPVKVPLSGKNKAILGHPDRLDAEATVESIPDVEFFAEGVPLFRGTLYVKDGGIVNGRPTASVFLVVNPLLSIKGKKLSEIINKVFSADSIRDVAKVTTTSPDDYDFLFFPVFNRYWHGNFTTNATIVTTKSFMERRTQNFYDTDSQEFVESKKNRAATPFLKVEYIVKEIMNDTGMSYTEGIFNTAEMRRLVIYNNFSITDKDGKYGKAIDYKNHVPDQKATEWLKELFSLFFLGLFSNPFDNTASVLSMENVIAAPEKYDWSTKVDEDYSGKNSKVDSPSSIQYEADQLDRMNEINIPRNYIITGTVGKDIDVPLSTEDDPKYYYCIEQNLVVKNIGKILPYKFFLSENVDVQSDFTYLIKMSPVFMYKGRTSAGYYYSLFIPEIATLGVYTTEDDSDPEDDEAYTGSQFGNRLMFYRGMDQAIDGKMYPMATNHVYNNQGDRVGDISLLLNGPDGILEKWGKSMIHFLENRRTVQRVINLSIKDIVNFRPENKVRIHNINYFVSSLRITFNSDGIQPVKATLESTL